MSELNKSAETLALEVATARNALRCSMTRVTIDLQTAGSVRVQAWKKAHESARKALAGDSLQPSVYLNARMALDRCATAEVDELAKQVFEG